MLEMNDVTKRYGQHVAVRDLNLYLDKGESVGLLGPNGAGKSTTIDMLSSLAKPTSGVVRFKGRPVSEVLHAFRMRIGVVPQEIALFPQLTAEENLLFFGKIYRLDKRELNKRVNELLGLVGLKEKRKDKVRTFSGGMKRRLNTAAALVHKPEFLLMDEPTIGIDPQSRRHILDLVKDLQASGGMTILYTSHYMEEVEYLCDRVYVMDRGSVIASGTIDEIKRILDQGHIYELKLAAHHHQLEQKLREDPRVESVAPTEDGYRVTASAANLFEPLLELATRSGARVLGIQVQTPTLEDVFLHLTGRTLRD